MYLGMPSDSNFAKSVCNVSECYQCHFACRFKPEALKASQPEVFDCKVKLLMGVMDYPCWGHLTRHRISPAIVGACYKCPIRGQRLGVKTFYPGVHFLQLFTHAIGI